MRPRDVKTMNDMIDNKFDFLVIEQTLKLFSEMDFVKRSFIKNQVKTISEQAFSYLQR